MTNWFIRNEFKLAELMAITMALKEYTRWERKRYTVLLVTKSLSAITSVNITSGARPDLVYATHRQIYLKPKT